MYYCNNCKCEFKRPIKKRITFEEYFGIYHLFSSYNIFDLLICPNCKSDDIEAMKQCDYCGEWNLENDLEDTEGLTNGGIGYLCPQCLEDCNII